MKHIQCTGEEPFQLSSSHTNYLNSAVSCSLEWTCSLSGNLDYWKKKDGNLFEFLLDMKLFWLSNALLPICLWYLARAKADGLNHFFICWLVALLIYILLYLLGYLFNSCGAHLFTKQLWAAPIILVMGTPLKDLKEQREETLSMCLPRVNMNLMTVSQSINQSEILFEIPNVLWSWQSLFWKVSIPHGYWESN